jgi:hypothetical protein
MGSVLVGEGVADGDKGPRAVLLNNPCKTEALLEDKLPQCDMSEELENPWRFSEFVGE